ncbi:MAG: hypothetical protein WC809_08895 [Sinimarinibacterium sp.]|jgi:D-glycerate 3-kinase
MKTLDAKARDRVLRYCRERSLSDVFVAAAMAELWPLAQWIAAQRNARNACLVVGINGAQGTGKSTLAGVLLEFLDLLGLRGALLALDDLYLPRVERLRLAETVHPLLATRGVPGTHDVALGLELLDRMKRLRADESLLLPRFDKANDDRADPARWTRVGGPIDVVLFEGWCVGTPPQDVAALALPVNALEADEDADGRWRRWVNERLATDYARLFAQIDRLVFLHAPDFAQVFAWRGQQEADTARFAGASGSRILDDAALRRFIGHYERLTRHALAKLPTRADVVVGLNADHRITTVAYRADAG